MAKESQMQVLVPPIPSQKIKNKAICLIKKTNNESSGEDVDKSSIYTLLAGMQTSPVVMEISIEVPQKIKSTFAIWPRYANLGIYLKDSSQHDTETPAHRVYCYSTVYIDNSWRQPSVHQRRINTENGVHTY